MAKGQALINEITAQYLKQDVPAFRPGDNVKVYVKIVEGDTHRIQVFEGLVIKRQGGGISETFTVRKISYGIGVERTRLRLLVLVRFVELSYIIFVHFLQKHLVSKNVDNEIMDQVYSWSFFVYLQSDSF